VEDKKLILVGGIQVVIRKGQKGLWYGGKSSSRIEEGAFANIQINSFSLASKKNHPPRKIGKKRAKRTEYKGDWKSTRES